MVLMYATVATKSTPHGARLLFASDTAIVECTLFQ